MQGVVVGFHGPRGYGTIRSDEGWEVSFHCTRIADGSRHIEVGTPVRFTVVPARGGSWEAAGIEPCPPAGGGQPEPGSEGAGP